MERTAIVTGGTGGAGTGVVARLLDDGWRVIVPWVIEQELDHVQLREGLELIQADLFDPAAVDKVIRTAGANRGAPLRGLVNLVGGFAVGGRVHETPVDDFEQQFRPNLRSTYLMIQAAPPKTLPNDPPARPPPLPAAPPPAPPPPPAPARP